MNGQVILLYLSIDMEVSRSIHPPLGLMYLAAVLRSHRIPATILDSRTDPAFQDRLRDILSRRPSSIVGFACDCANSYKVRVMAGRILDAYPKAIAVFGGAQATHQWRPFLGDRRIVVRGEGEYPMLRLADCLLRGRGQLKDVPGIVFRRGGKIHLNPISLGPFEDVDSIPFPDWVGIDLHKGYRHSIITARGCLHNCRFCSEGSRRTRYRPRGIANIEKELTALKGFCSGHIPHLFFADDTLTVSPSRVREICELLDRVFPDKSRFTFSCDGRVDVLSEHPDLIFRLQQAGLRSMVIGIESGDQKTLDRIDKRIRAEQIEAVVNACRDADIPLISGNFICGLPGQTEDDVLGEIVFAKRLSDLAPGRLELRMAPLIPLPGTEFWMHAKRWGLSVLDPQGTSTRMGRCFAETKDLSCDRIEALCYRFRREVEHHLVKGAALLSPKQIKERFVLEADHFIRTPVVARLTEFGHIQNTLCLRRRSDHRFLFEVPEEATDKVFPITNQLNTLTPANGQWVINEHSPMHFRLSQGEMEIYRLFTGQIPFSEVAQRATRRLGKGRTFQSCLDVYRMCEDKLAAMVML